jgi:hypothetical protein
MIAWVWQRDMSSGFVLFTCSLLICGIDSSSQKLREYIKAEHQNKKKKDFDFTGWQDWAPDVSSFGDYPESN